MKDKRTGCRNPDCVTCTTARGERPASPVMREFADVYEQMQAATEAGSERRMTFEVSAASLIFLAFLNRLVEAQDRSDLRRPVGIIDIDDPVEQARAGRFLAHVIRRNDVVFIND